MHKHDGALATTAGSDEKPSVGRFTTGGFTGPTPTPVLKKVSLVMLGGSLGAAGRYSIGLLAAKSWGTQFPGGTLTVNLIGYSSPWPTASVWLTPAMRLMLITGFLGALTTFSSFSLETVNAGRAGLTLQPLVNVLVNNLGGFALTFVGLWLGGLK
ncbi:MAG: CrcB family protein [Desulfosarcinaceae bacterium]